MFCLSKTRLPAHPSFIKPLLALPVKNSCLSEMKKLAHRQHKKGFLKNQKAFPIHLPAQRPCVYRVYDNPLKTLQSPSSP